MHLSQQPRAIFEITEILIDMLLLHVTNGSRSGGRFFARTDQTGGEHSFKT